MLNYHLVRIQILCFVPFFVIIKLRKQNVTKSATCKCMQNLQSNSETDIWKVITYVAADA